MQLNKNTLSSLQKKVDIKMPTAKALLYFWNNMFLDYGEITNCKNQDLNLGWTSFIFKAAPMPNEDFCKNACSTNPGCDFYTFIDSIPFNLGTGVNCLCGEFKKPAVPVPLFLIESVTEVTLKFKKGE